MSFSAIVKLDVKGRYPNVWRYHLTMKKTRPEGSKTFYTTFPVFGLVIDALNIKEGNRAWMCGLGGRRAGRLLRALRTQHGECCSAFGGTTSVVLRRSR